MPSAKLSTVRRLCRCVESAPILALLLVFTPGSVLGQTFQFATHVPSPGLTTATNATAVGDLDGDGDLDLLGWSSFQGVELFYNDGRGEFVSEVVPGTIPLFFSLAAWPFLIDYDGDQDLDILISEQVGARLFRNDGFGAWVDVSGNLSITAPIMSGVVADFDGDGDQDIAGAGFALGGGYNQMFVNGGGGAFTSVTPFPSSWGVGIDAADIDGDGDLDLAVSEFGARIWRNDGGMAFTDITAQSLPAGANTSSYLAFGDVDRDADQDLVFSGAGGLAGEVLHNDGSGSFAIVPQALPPFVGTTRSMLLVDVDEDGDLDLVRGTTANGVTLARNDGMGFFTDEPNAASVSSPGYDFLLAGDFDGDLDVDLFTAAAGTAPQLLANQHRHLRSAGAPVAGMTWNVEVVSEPGYANTPRFSVLGIAGAALPTPIVSSSIGSLWLAPAQVLLATAELLPAGSSVATFSLPVPPIPALAGFPVAVQASVRGLAAASPVRLTPMLRATIQ